MLIPGVLSWFLNQFVTYVISNVLFKPCRNQHLLEMSDWYRYSFLLYNHLFLKDCVCSDHVLVHKFMFLFSTLLYSSLFSFFKIKTVPFSFCESLHLLLSDACFSSPIGWRRHQNLCLRRHGRHGRQTYVCDRAWKPLSALTRQANVSAQTRHGNLCLRRHGRQTYVCTDLFAVLETIEYKKMAKSMQGMMGEKSLDLTVDSCWWMWFIGSTSRSPVQTSLCFWCLLYYVLDCKS